jgi:hypothetical protein
MSFPLIVEAAETLFHPVAIRNNVEGYEGKIREQCKEPSWNYPVMRFVNGKSEDILPRQDKLYSPGQVLQRFTAVLAACQQVVPKWLETVTAEFSINQVQTALVAMT